MKICLTLLLTLFIVGCNSKKDDESLANKQKSIAVIVDITDAKTLKLYPTVNPILSLYKFEEAQEQAYSFTLSIISNLKTNPTYQSYLPNDSVTEKLNKNDDVQFRKKMIRLFQDSTSKIFKRFYEENDTNKSLPFSECWSSIAKNLEELSLQPTGEKYLIVFSDLQELSLTGSAYNSFKKMSVEAIGKKLISEIQVPKNLEEIELIIVYQPRDRDDDLRFTKMLKVYKHILQNSGLAIRHKANNENFIENK
jgi:hypothetical protein